MVTQIKLVECVQLSTNVARYHTHLPAPPSVSRVRLAGLSYFSGLRRVEIVVRGPCPRRLASLENAKMKIESEILALCPNVKVIFIREESM
jgi:hypothetical protein